MSQLSRYRKTVVAVLVAAAVIGNQVAAKVLDLYGDHEWSSTDTIVTVSVLLSALLVYQVPNKAPRGQAADPNESVVGPGATR